MPFNSMAKRDRKRAGGAGVKRGYHDGKLARPQGHIRRGRNGAAAYAYDDGYIVAQYRRYGRCCKAARRRGHDRRIQNAKAVALDKPYAGRNNGRHILLFDGAYNAQAEYIADSVAYFRIIMSGQFFACIGMTINAAQRGCGNTKVSMRSNVTANLVNIVFNYLLINGNFGFPKLGVVGAAIATAIGHMVAFLMALYSVVHPHKGELNIVDGGKWGFDKKTLSSVTKVATGAFTEQISLRAGLFAFSSIIARLGTIQFATHQISMSLSQLIFSFADGLGVASSSLVGQGLGMRRPDLSTIYGKIGQRCSMLIGFTLSLLLVIFRRPLYGLFTDDAEVIALGMRLCYFVAAVCMIQTSQVVISGCLRGAGDSRYVAVTSLVSIGTFRVGLSYLLCYPLGIGVYGAWIGFLVDQCTRLVLNYTRFHRGGWTKIEL